MKFGAFLVAAAAAQYAGDGTVSITRDTTKNYKKIYQKYENHQNRHFKTTFSAPATKTVIPQQGEMT